MYCELFSCLVDVKVVMEKKNVRVEESHLPLLGICYGLQEIAYHYGGTVASCEHREYGHALVGIVDNLSGEGRVLI